MVNDEGSQIISLLKYFTVALMFYAGAYVAIIMVNELIQGLDVDVNAYMITLAFCALGFAIGGAVGFHFLTHKLGKTGWIVLLISTPLLIGVGSIFHVLSKTNEIFSETFSIVSICAMVLGVVGLTMLLDPTRMDAWIKDTLGLKSNGRLFVVTTIFGFLLLFYSVLISYYFCDIMYSVLTYCLIGVGITWMVLFARDMVSGKRDFISREEILEGIKCREATGFEVAISWVNMLTWHAIFVLIFLIWYDLGFLGSMTLPIPINVVGFVQILGFFGGILAMVVIRLVLRGKEKVLNVISLVCLGCFALLLFIFLGYQEMLDQMSAFLFRLVLVVLVAPAFSGVYFMDVPRLQMISLNFFKGLSVVLSLVLIIVGVVIIDQNERELFNVMYILMIASCAISLVLYQANHYFKERRVVNES